jgi:antitoxin PrlF
MPSATMTTKGQITIPVQVRKALRLKPGAQIDFYESGEGEYTLRARTGSIREMEGCLAHLRTGGPMSVEEMNEAVLDHADALDRESRNSVRSDKPEGEAA